MRLILTVTAAAVGTLLASCSNSADKARADYTFLKEHNGTPRELCAAATKVEAATADAQDATGYKYAQISRQAECLNVETFPQYADMPGGVPRASDEEIANQLAALNSSTTK